MSGEPHSVIYFTDSRDHWWNDDFIALMARRLDVARFRRVLDVGCGYGHWTRVWLPHLSPEATVVGLDPEPASLREAARRTEQRRIELGLTTRLEWQRGTAEALPFPDGSFDLVTAQTVLIHVADVAVVLRELARVLAPGGLLLLAEPDNLAGTMSDLIESPELDPDLALTLVELELRIQRGKYALGEGFNSAGAYLTRHLDPALFEDVRAWANDRCRGLQPPYASPQDQASIAELRDFQARGWFGRKPDEARRCFLAGGGTAEAFERAWAMGLEHTARRLAAIDAGTYGSTGGDVFPLIAATRRG